MFVRFLKWVGIVPKTEPTRVVKLGAPKEQHQQAADEALRGVEFERYAPQGMPEAPTRWFWE